MLERLSARGTPAPASGRIVGRVTRSDAPPEARHTLFRVLSRGNRQADLTGYRAILTEDQAPAGLPTLAVGAFDSLELLRDNYVAVLEPRLGRIQVVYRPESRHNFLFATERCSSRCLMCSQPPRDGTGEGEAAELLRVVDLIPNSPEHLGISGGEPTLLGDGLVEVLRALARRLPSTAVTMLSNGRLYCYEELVQRIATVSHPQFITSIPIHGDCAADHDYVAQVRGAFDQTVQGLYNAATHGLRIEVRVVLHKFTIPVLGTIVEFIYRNLPFVEHVALMGLENIGFAKGRRDLLYIDPIDYQGELEAAVRYCWNRRMGVSIYNLPLCLLPREIWSFARQSISDYKNAFAAECTGCVVRERCSGMFASAVSATSRGLKAIPA